jgi:hypothetical protein
VKTNRTIQHRFAPAAIATLLALAFTAPDGAGILAQSRSKPSDSSAGKVDGKLTIDGKAIQLKYAYARRDSAASPLVDLIMTNQPLSDDAIAAVLAVKYRGSDKLKGLWLILDSKGTYRPPQLLIDSGEVSASGGVMEMMTGNDVTTIESGRIRGKLECKINTPARTTSFVFSFDAPLIVAASDTAAAVTSPDQFRKDFERVMPGKWYIETWRTSGAETYSGALTVEARPAGAKFRGVFHLVFSRDGRKVDEEVTISRDGTKVLMEGQIAPGTSWASHKLTLELRGDRLVGGARNQRGTESNVMLRKAPESAGGKANPQPAKPPGKRVASPSPARAADDLALKHDWRVVQGNDTVNYASNDHAISCSCLGSTGAASAVSRPMGHGPRCGNRFGGHPAPRLRV